MDRHQMLRAYSHYKKMAIEAKEETKKVEVSRRKYTALRSVLGTNTSDDSLLTNDFSKRKYIQLKPKAE